MTIYYRPATDAEIIEAQSKYTPQISYKHGAMETIHHTAKSGVQHRTIGRSKIYVIDGKPYVQRRGKKVRVWAQHMSWKKTNGPGMSEHVVAYRITKPYTEYYCI
jgi:hypothetical protein